MRLSTAGKARYLPRTVQPQRDPQRLPHASSGGSEGQLSCRRRLPWGLAAEAARPFAVVIIGGLVTATLLALLTLPILYPSFEPETAE